jgi:hypothetical protein
MKMLEGAANPHTASKTVRQKQSVPLVKTSGFSRSQHRDGHGHRVGHGYRETDSGMDTDVDMELDTDALISWSST